MTDGFNGMASLFDRYIRSVGQVMFHPVSTTPMASRELGGVVDSNLIVYGTQNLRVGKSILFLKKKKEKKDLLFLRRSLFSGCRYFPYSDQCHASG